eukprot:8555300-Heterocapsa_arctica.AAC.1
MQGLTTLGVAPAEAISVPGDLGAGADASTASPEGLPLAGLVAPPGLQEPDGEPQDMDCSQDDF